MSTPEPLTADAILAVLRAHEAELKRRGVRHIALFGSTARGQARPDSDIDLLVDLDPNTDVSIFDYVNIRLFLNGLFGRPVDLANMAGLRNHVRPTAERDARHAF